MLLLHSALQEGDGQFMGVGKLVHSFADRRTSQNCVNNILYALLSDRLLESLLTTPLPSF